MKHFSTNAKSRVLAVSGAQFHLLLKNISIVICRILKGEVGEGDEKGLFGITIDRYAAVNGTRIRLYKKSIPAAI